MQVFDTFTYAQAVDVDEILDLLGTVRHTAITMQSPHRLVITAPDGAVKTFVITNGAFDFVDACGGHDTGQVFSAVNAEAGPRGGQSAIVLSWRSREFRYLTIRTDVFSSTDREIPMVEITKIEPTEDEGKF